MKQQKTLWVIFWIFVLVGLGLLTWEIGNGGHIGASAINSSDLTAKVTTDINGINVANQESSTWTSCEVGVNGGCGWDFQDPPYRTHENMTISAGQNVSVPYSSLTASDGTRFDIATHGVNSIVVMCSMGTTDMVQRSFCGAH